MLGALGEVTVATNMVREGKRGKVGQLMSVHQ